MLGKLVFSKRVLAVASKRTILLTAPTCTLVSAKNNNSAARFYATKKVKQVAQEEDESETQSTYEVGTKKLLLSEEEEKTLLDVEWTNEAIFDRKYKLKVQVVQMYQKGLGSFAYRLLEKYYYLLTVKEEAQDPEQIKNGLVSLDDPESGPLFAQKSLKHVLLDAIILSYYGHSLRAEASNEQSVKKGIEVLKKSLVYFKKCKELRQRETNPTLKEANQAEENMAEYQACLSVAEALFSSDMHKEAIPHLQRAQELSPAEQRPRYLLAASYEELNNKDAAEKVYLDLISQFPQDATVIGDTAIFYRDHRMNYSKSAELFKKALELDPKNSNNLYNYGFLLFHYLKDMEAAEKYLKSAVEIDPKDDRILSVLAAIKLQQGEYEASRNYYKRTVDVDPMNLSAITNTAFVEYTLGEFDHALKTYKHAFAVMKQLELMKEKAVSSGSISKLRARKILQQEDTVDYATLYSTYANVLFETEKFDEAEQNYAKALTYDKNNISILGNYALVLDQNGKPEAETYYKKIYSMIEAFLSEENSKLIPTDIIQFNTYQTHKNNLGHYAQFLVKRKKYQEALSCYDLIIKLIDLQGKISKIKLPSGQKEYVDSQNATFYLNYANLLKNKNKQKSQHYEALGKQIQADIEKLLNDQKEAEAASKPSLKEMVTNQKPQTPSKKK